MITEFPSRRHTGVVANVDSTVISDGRLRFLVLGDSIAYGTGARRVEETVGWRLAQVLEREGCEVDLRVLAVQGATSRDLGAQVRRAVAIAPDIALVVIGANDLTRLVPPAQAAAALGAAVRELRATGAQVVVAPAPDFADFPAVPPAFRPLVREACLQLQREQAAATVAAGGAVAPVSAELARAFAADPALYSPDRFHPSSAGYALIAEVLAPYIVSAARAQDELLQRD